MIYKTVGTGGDFSTIAAAYNWIGGAGQGDHVDFDLISDVSEPNAIVAFISTAGYNVRFHCSHNEENIDDKSVWYRVVRMPSASPMHYFALDNGGGEFKFDNMLFSWLPSTSDSNSWLLYLVSHNRAGTTKSVIVDKCVFAKCETGLGILGLHFDNINTLTVKSSLFFGQTTCALRISTSKSGTKIVDNCSFGKNGIGVTTKAYGGLDTNGNGTGITFKNCVSIWDSSARSSGSDYEMTYLGNASFINCRSQDTSLDGIGTNCSGGIVPDNEFKSLNIIPNETGGAARVDSSYMVPKNNSTGSLASAGVASSVLTDLNGYDIPDANDNYAIGCYRSVNFVRASFTASIMTKYKDKSYAVGMKEINDSIGPQIAIANLMGARDNNGNKSYIDTLVQ
jgi:hypothetical protein